MTVARRKLRPSPLVAERGDRGRVGEPDHAVVIHDPDRLLGRLEHRREDLLGSDPQAGKIDQGLGHPARSPSLRRHRQPAGRAARCRACSVRSRGGRVVVDVLQRPHAALDDEPPAGSSSLSSPTNPESALTSAQPVATGSGSIVPVRRCSLIAVMASASPFWPNTITPSPGAVVDLLAGGRERGGRAQRRGVVVGPDGVDVRGAWSTGRRRSAARSRPCPSCCAPCRRS